MQTIGQKIALKYYPDYGFDKPSDKIRRENLSNLIDNEVNEYIFQEKLSFAERSSEKQFHEHVD